MALGDPYCSLAEIKDYLAVPASKTSLDAALTDAIASATSEIERICNRQFNQVLAATARTFKPVGWRIANVDDFYSTTGLVVKTDPGGTGSFTDTWLTTDYELKPFDALVNGRPWPYTTLRAVSGRFFPIYTDQPFRHEAVLQVTALWGWPSVPQPVRQACLIMAAETFRLKDAPFGVAGMTSFGSPLRVRDNPMALKKLAPFVRNAILVG